MKQVTVTTRQKRNSVIAFLLALLVFSATGFAQSKSSTTGFNNKYAIQNLVNGINSENEGVKRNCIYFAGKYGVKEAVNPLLDLLQTEENPNTKILIALSLFYINAPEGLNAVKALAQNDDNVKVRNMSQAIYVEYLARAGGYVNVGE